MRGMENDSRFGVLGVNASGLDGERVELGRFGVAEVQKHGIIPPSPTPTPNPKNLPKVAETTRAGTRRTPTTYVALLLVFLVYDFVGFCVMRDGKCGLSCTVHLLRVT